MERGLGMADKFDKCPKRDAGLHHCPHARAFSMLGTHSICCFCGTEMEPEHGPFLPKSGPYPFMGK